MINKMKKSPLLLVISIIISFDFIQYVMILMVYKTGETDSINKQKCKQLVSVFTESITSKRIMLML